MSVPWYAWLGFFALSFQLLDSLRLLCGNAWLRAKYGMKLRSRELVWPAVWFVLALKCLLIWGT